LSASLGKVLVTAESVYSSRDALKYLEEAGCEVTVKRPPSPSEANWLREHVGDFAGLIVAMEPLTREVLQAAHQLKVIARPGVGYDTVDISVASARGIAVTVAAGLNHQSVADFTLGLLLLMARGIGTASADVQRGKWQRETGTEVWCKTLLLFGFGRIGQAVAQRARGFDMRVLVTTRTRIPPETAGVMPVTLEEGLARADFVSLHAPLTEATKNIINARTLALMKPATYLINTARAGLVDELALASAIRRGALAGAALDAIQNPGANSDSPLIGIPGILITPHMATFAREAMARVALSAVQSVVTVLKGGRPSGLINPEVFLRN
jgi:phosphoglycerate dehydrogenase-like enzyme